MRFTDDASIALDDYMLAIEGAISARTGYVTSASARDDDRRTADEDASF